MSVQVERLEGNMAKITVEVAAAELDKAIQKVYNKQKNSFNMPGFRKGKVPYAMIEKMYGASVFYEDAANELLQASYGDAVDESELEVVSSPKIDIVQIEKGQPFIYTAEVAVKPSVELGEYKGISVDKVDVKVSAKEVNEAIEKERNNNARVVAVEDRAAKMDDVVVIDFDGYIDGEAFEGGQAEGYTLGLGSHTFIEGFEEQIVGKSIGDAFDVNVTFPENYQAAELAGKPAVFKVVLHEIKEKILPELNDDFAQDVSEFDTLAEYKDSVKAKLKEEKEKEAKLTQEDEAINKVVEGCKMEIPAPMIQSQCDAMMDEMGQNLAMSGVSLEQYFQITGQDMASFREQCKPRAEQRIRTTLVLEAIAKAENVEITEEQIKAEFGKMAEQYGMEADTLYRVVGEAEKKQVVGDLEIQAAIDIIMANAKITAAKKASKKDAEEAAETEE